MRWQSCKLNGGQVSAQTPAPLLWTLVWSMLWMVNKWTSIALSRIFNSTPKHFKFASPSPIHTHSCHARRCMGAIRVKCPSQGAHNDRLGHSWIWTGNLSVSGQPTSPSQWLLWTTAIATSLVYSHYFLLWLHYIVNWEYWSSLTTATVQAKVIVGPRLNPLTKVNGWSWCTVWNAFQTFSVTQLLCLPVCCDTMLPLQEKPPVWFHKLVCVSRNPIIKHGPFQLFE